MHFSHLGQRSPESSEGFKPWTGCRFPTGRAAVQATDGHVLFPGHVPPGKLRPFRPEDTPEKHREEATKKLVGEAPAAGTVV